MINVVEKIRKCTKLYLIDKFQKDTMKSFELKRALFTFPVSDYKEEIFFGMEYVRNDPGIFENGIINIDGFGSLTIFQSYGDNELKNPDGTIEVPSELVFPQNKSFGIYNGRYCIICADTECIYIYLLDDRDSIKVDWEKLYSKRPFGSCLYAECNCHTTKLHLLVRLHISGGDSIDMNFEIPIDYWDIVKPDNIWRMVLTVQTGENYHFDFD